jgi:hypothetical protein
MAEQRATESGGRSPAHEGSLEGRDKAQEASAQVSETARHVRETASASYEQGREQIAHVGQSLEEHMRGKPLQSVVMARVLGCFWRSCGRNNRYGVQAAPAFALLSTGILQDPVILSKPVILLW